MNLSLMSRLAQADHSFQNNAFHLNIGSFNSLRSRESDVGIRPDSGGNYLKWNATYRDDRLLME
jgi:hypothetical protein